MLPYINVPFDYVAKATGASTDEIKLISSFLMSYPLAAVLKRLPDSKPEQKNLFIIGVSLFYIVGLFDLWSGLVTLSIGAMGAYTIAASVSGPYMPWLGFIFLMGHMSLSHIYRQIANSPNNVDITGAQMVMVMKLTGFCWNVYDGQQPESSLVDFQKSRAIRKLPSYLDYAGYVLFFPSLFAGPAFDYADYQRWIETTMFEVPPGTDPAQAPKVRKKRKIPRSGTPAAWKAAQGLGWIFLFMNFGSWYNTSLVLSDEYMTYGFLRRVWILQMLGFSTRLKYYGVWMLTEGACILSGLGYKGVDPKTGKVNWNRLQNVNPIGIETAQNSRAYLENWNMNTNNWLRNYVYLRVTPKGKKPGFRASLATFGTSAFWHGFYPGYYLSFTMGAFIQTAAKNFRRFVRPFFLKADGQTPTGYKIYYDIATYFATQTIFSFTTAPFVLLTLPDSLKVWTRVYFYAIILVGGSMAFFASPGKVHLVQELKKRQAGISNVHSVESMDLHPVLGMPDDPAKEIDEAVTEIREEVEARRRRGSKVTMPNGQELRALVENKLGKKLK
ncbi:MAG: lysophospholipid acyltransferase [Stictis urceolatum]|nr:lysophospholipid acyltransferase [Stictis urceolata]